MPVLLMLVTIPFGLVMLFFPMGYWRATAWMSYRNPDRVEPSARHVRFWQVTAVVYLLMGGAIPLAIHNERAGGWLGLALAALMLVMMVRAFTAPEVPDSVLPPNEPSPLQYATWVVAYVVVLGVAVVLSFRGISVPTDSDIRGEWVEKGRAQWEAAFVAELPTWEHASTNLLHEPSGKFIEVDHQLREPSQLFAVAEAIGPRAVAQFEATDLILLAHSDFGCTVTGAVVRDGGVVGASGRGSIEVALVSNQGSHISDCVGDLDIDRPLQAVFVDLDEPLGDRYVTSYTEGGGCDRPLMWNDPSWERDPHVCSVMAWSTADLRRDGYVDPLPRRLEESDSAGR